MAARSGSTVSSMLWLHIPKTAFGVGLLLPRGLAYATDASIDAPSGRPGATRVTGVRVDPTHGGRHGAGKPCMPVSHNASGRGGGTRLVTGGR